MRRKADDDAKYGGVSFGFVAPFESLVGKVDFDMVAIEKLLP